MADFDLMALRSMCVFVCVCVFLKREREITKIQKKTVQKSYLSMYLTRNEAQFSILLIAVQI